MHKIHRWRHTYEDDNLITKVILAELGDNLLAIQSEVYGVQWPPFDNKDYIKVEYFVLCSEKYLFRLLVRLTMTGLGYLPVFVIPRRKKRDGFFLIFWSNNFPFMTSVLISRNC